MDRRERIAQKLRIAREQAGLTQHEFAKLYGCQDPTVSMMESGKRTLGIKVLERVSHIVGKPVSWFIADEMELPEAAPPRPLSSILREAVVAQERLEVREVPVMGKINAGTLKVSEQILEGYIPIPVILLPQVNKDFYALTVEGNSLVGDDIHDGDTVIIEPDPEYVDGKIFIVKVENEVVARHVRKQKNKLRLESSNGNYSVIEPSQVELQGRVVLKGHWDKV